ISLMPKKVKKPSFEETLQRLETIVEKMESGEATLEKSLDWFEEGMELIKSCQDELEQAEQKVQELVEKSGGEFDLREKE
ncbi:MAG: exodeoxyribonuclease VII small subunit, partial [Candidatus Neomarinimicrobiota bacterium]|nr:exodeoxyribonuclease VII small subunit [Candidatus Neomarinimicrobiota bacterium]